MCEGSRSLIVIAAHNEKSEKCILMVDTHHPVHIVPIKSSLLCVWRGGAGGLWGLEATAPGGELSLVLC